MAEQEDSTEETLHTALTHHSDADDDTFHDAVEVHEVEIEEFPPLEADDAGAAAAFVVIDREVAPQQLDNLNVTERDGDDTDVAGDNSELYADEQAGGDNDELVDDVQRFDTSLPSAHQYLGNDMLDVFRNSSIDQQLEFNIPVHVESSVVLVPNQIVPLQLFLPRQIAMIKHVMDKDKTFAFVCERVLYNYRNLLASHKALIGTLAEIISVSSDLEQLAPTTIKLQVIGRKKLLLKSFNHQTDGLLTARVRVIEDIHMRNAYYPVIPPKLRPNSRKRCRSRQLVHTDGVYSLTTWPSFLVQAFTTDRFMRSIKEILLGLGGDTYAAGQLITDPAAFSYWLTANVSMISENERLSILAIPSDIERLIYIHNLFKNKSFSGLSCVLCREHLALISDIFSMSVIGPSGAYVNPHGHVHELITVRKSEAVNGEGEPSTEHSWFPGYAWTILYCSNCGHFLGWRFTATTDTLIPRVFIGLSRQTVTTATDRRRSEFIYDTESDNSVDMDDQPMII